MIGPKAIIHLDRLKTNYDLVKKQVGNKPIMAVVKANGYGHGSIACAKALESHGCDYFSVFTMDEGISNAVRKAFVDLYNANLIYKDKRLVNWDPKLLTAISDLEVEQKEQEGFIWYIKYPINENNNIIIATTRPETMLGDTAVAVHPDDERYKKYIGLECFVPLVERKIKILSLIHI